MDRSYEVSDTAFDPLKEDHNWMYPNLKVCLSSPEEFLITKSVSSSGHA